MLKRSLGHRLTMVYLESDHKITATYFIQNGRKQHAKKESLKKVDETDLSAYRSVLSVCSQQLRPGEIMAIYK